MAPRYPLQPTRLLASLLFIVIFTATSTLAQKVAAPAPGLAPINKYTWRVSVGNRAPDCFERPVLLVNDEFGPTLEVHQGDLLEIDLVNDIPPDFPAIPGGVSIHWHGFRMINESWNDGASFINQCPVQSGQKFTYRFVVDEIPGTYMWHAHAGTILVDGLLGPLIVRPPRGQPNSIIPLPNNVTIDGEKVLFVHDWYQKLSALLTAPLNRPFYGTADWTPNDGNFTWVGMPQSVLINGKAVFQDCAAPPAGSPAGTNATCTVPSLNGTLVTGANSTSTAASSSECTHEQIEVEAGKTYLFRVINGGGLLYQTICFEGHNVTIIAADAIPINPLPAPSSNCLDVNIGQRYDVLLTANAQPGSYWISAQAQFRPGAPSGFAVLKYVNRTDSTDPSPELPTTPVPQPGSQPTWTTAFINQITINPIFLEPNSPAKTDSVYNVATTPVPAATAFMMVNISQPVMNTTGSIGWALNNIVGLETPPCNNLQNLLTSDPRWLSTSAAKTVTGEQNATFVADLTEQTGPGVPNAVFLANLTTIKEMALNPTLGSHIAPVKLGQVVEVVIQNNPANSFNGNGNRTAQEQHPFHLHGHHFWYMGSGTGTYPGAEAAAASLNTVNPPLRDTMTLYPNTWIVFRFLANNPGTWLLHCHIPFHQAMGQAMAFAESTENIPKAPAGMPKCPSPCSYSAAPWTLSYTAEKFGKYIPPAPAPGAVPPAAAPTASTPPVPPASGGAVAVNELRTSSLVLAVVAMALVNLFLNTI